MTGEEFAKNSSVPQGPSLQYNTGWSTRSNYKKLDSVAWGIASVTDSHVNIFVIDNVFNWKHECCVQVWIVHSEWLPMVVVY